MSFFEKMIKSNVDDIINEKYYDESTNIMHIKIVHPNIIYIKIDSEIEKTVYVGKYQKKILDFELSIIKNGYFIRNSFLCEPDELIKKELIKSKSDNCLDIIEIDLINLKKQHLLDINKYTKLLYDLVRNDIIDLIKDTIYNWYSNIDNIIKQNMSHNQNLLKKNTQDLLFLKLIKDTFNNYISSNKNILLIIKELIEQVKLMEHSEEYIIILDNFNDEFKRLNKNNEICINTNKLSIQKKLKEQHKITQILNLLIKKIFKPQEELLIIDKKTINNNILLTSHQFNKFNKLIKLQITKFFDDLHKSIKIFIKKNIKNIQIYNKINFNGSTIKLELGNEELSSTSININICDFIIIFDKIKPKI